MIPGICNVCHTTLFGNEARSHVARCVEARCDIRGTRVALKGRGRTVHISVGSPERPHWMEFGVLVRWVTVLVPPSYNLLYYGHRRSSLGGPNVS